MDREQGKVLVQALNTEIGQSLVRWFQDYQQLGKESDFLHNFFSECAKEQIEALVEGFNEEYPEIVITHLSWVCNGPSVESGYTVNTDWGLNTGNEE